jgi:hypothetical protein
MWHSAGLTGRGGIPSPGIANPFGDGESIGDDQGGLAAPSTALSVRKNPSSFVINL